MPTQITLESPHQRQMRLDRDERHRNAQWDRVVEQHRGEAERAQGLNRRASRVEEHIARYDADEQFRERVTEERAAHRTKIMVLVFIGLIAVIDFLLATPDASENLAAKAMTYVPKTWAQIEKINGHDVTITPVWCRAIIGVSVVAVFLSITLGIKKVTNTSKLQVLRNAVEPGDTRNYNQLTFGVWFLRLGRVGYMILLGFLFYHLFDYDLQRAKWIEKNEHLEREMRQAYAPQLLTSNGSGPGGSTGSPINEDQSSPDEDSAGMAKASAVVFCCLWILHGILFLLPSDCFGRDLELAGFRRVKAETHATAMREEETALLYNIRDRMFAVPEGEQRNQLLRIALPVGARINEVSGFEVIPNDLLASRSSAGGSQVVNPQTGNGAPSATPVHPGTNGHDHITPSGSPINGSNGQHPTDETEAPVADWDAIFPSGRRA